MNGNTHSLISQSFRPTSICCSVEASCSRSPAEMLGPRLEMALENCGSIDRLAFVSVSSVCRQTSVVTQGRPQWADGAQFVMNIDMC